MPKYLQHLVVRICTYAPRANPANGFIHTSPLPFGEPNSYISFNSSLSLARETCAPIDCSPSIPNPTYKHPSHQRYPHGPSQRQYSSTSSPHYQSQGSPKMLSSTHSNRPATVPTPARRGYAQCPDIEYRQLISRAVTQRLHSPLDDVSGDQWEIDERRTAQAKARARLCKLGVTWGTLIIDPTHRHLHHSAMLIRCR